MFKLSLPGGGRIWYLIALVSLQGCSDQPANYPYGKLSSSDNVFFSSFTQQPKTLDPARSYSAEEWVFIAQIIEPPLQYDYLKRPYTLIPATTVTMPTVTYLDSQKRPLPASTPINSIAYTTYRIQIKPHIYYQPHPAFAKNADGNYSNLHLTSKQISQMKNLQTQVENTRELTAEDYVYEIKRLASPSVNSPLSGLMNEYIEGFSDLTTSLSHAYQPNHYLDLRSFTLMGATVVDRYTYEITIKGYYQQFIYWLATTFFGPMAWEVDAFYAQPGMHKKNWSLDTYPVGSGPYLLQENNPNSHIILVRNPNFHGETYPTIGTAEDKAKGYLKEAGKALPFIDMFFFTLEQESIPRWNKFLQGYYDTSGIASDNFDQAIRLTNAGSPLLTKEMAQKGIRLVNSIQPSVFYFGFNMLDPVVGGYSSAQRKLRQAIAIAVNTEEYITIFLNGRGQAAQQPLPPDIMDYESSPNTAINKTLYHLTNGQIQRNSLQKAKQLLAEAGYPNGISLKTGKPLVLSYDAVSGQGGDERAQFEWMQKQFSQLGIQLIINDTDYNRFQEKMRTGNAQMFFWGWSADYPDPENFYFLLYGPNSKVKGGGENASNYNNPQFNQLFEQMRSMPNGPARQAIVDQMNQLFQEDTPWFGAFNAETYALMQPWVIPGKLNTMANNTLKYIKIDPKKRAQLQREWNQPHWGSLVIVIVLLLLSVVPFAYKYGRIQHQPPRKINRK